jgi:hypothetical protein
MYVRSRIYFPLASFCFPLVAPNCRAFSAIHGVTTQKVVHELSCCPSMYVRSRIYFPLASLCFPLVAPNCRAFSAIHGVTTQKAVHELSCCPSMYVRSRIYFPLASFCFPLVAPNCPGVFRNTWRCHPEGSTLHSHCFENLRSKVLWVLWSLVA